jgi:hypothetical protein
MSTIFSDALWQIALTLVVWGLIGWYLEWLYFNWKQNRRNKRLCPYRLEVHNEEVEAMLCDYCYHERAMDI